MTDSVPGVLGLPANASLPQRKRRDVSSDEHIPSAINQIVFNCDRTTHSSLDHTPRDTCLQQHVPLYKRMADQHGVCTQGAACTPAQKRGTRKRAVTTPFKTGDLVRLMKQTRLFTKRTDAKTWTAVL